MRRKSISLTDKIEFQAHASGIVLSRKGYLLQCSKSHKKSPQLTAQMKSARRSPALSISNSLVGESTLAKEQADESAPQKNI
jgi:hypothetical protein